MKGTNSVLGGGGFHHVAIKVRDIDVSIQFYTTVLGFKEKIRWGEGEKRGILLDTGDGNYLEIFAGGPQDPKPAGTIFHFAIRTTDCKAALERARAAGAKVTMPYTEAAFPCASGPVPIKIAFIEGPDGESVEFFENEAT